MREARTDCCPPAWKERDAYDRMLELDLAGWTWEALRRRPDDAGRILPLVGTRLVRRSPPLRVFETQAEDGPEIWGWRFPRPPVAGVGLLARRSRPGRTDRARRSRRSGRWRRLPVGPTAVPGDRPPFRRRTGADHHRRRRSVHPDRSEGRERAERTGPAGLRPRGVRRSRYRTAGARPARSPPPVRPFVAHALPGGNHGRTVGRWPFGPGTVGETARASARSPSPCSVLIA